METGISKCSLNDQFVVLQELNYEALRAKTALSDMLLCKAKTLIDTQAKNIAF